MPKWFLWRNRILKAGIRSPLKRLKTFCSEFEASLSRLDLVIFFEYRCEYCCQIFPNSSGISSKAGCKPTRGAVSLPWPKRAAPNADCAKSVSKRCPLIRTFKMVAFRRKSSSFWGFCLWWILLWVHFWWACQRPVFGTPSRNHCRLWLGLPVLNIFGTWHTSKNRKARGQKSCSTQSSLPYCHSVRAYLSRSL